MGGSFGVGKSSTARMIASKYASNYFSTDSTINRLPIFVSLKDGLTVEYRQYGLAELFRNVLAPSDSDDDKLQEYLLILDGLDEYVSKENKTLMKELSDYFGRYKNLN